MSDWLSANLPNFLGILLTGSLLSALTTWLKGRSERKKLDADTEKVSVEIGSVVVKNAEALVAMQSTRMAKQEDQLAKQDERIEAMRGRMSHLEGYIEATRLLARQNQWPMPSFEEYLRTQLGGTG